MTAFSPGSDSFINPNKPYTLTHTSLLHLRCGAGGARHSSHCSFAKCVDVLFDHGLVLLLSTRKELTCGSRDASWPFCKLARYVLARDAKSKGKKGPAKPADSVSRTEAVPTPPKGADGNNGGQGGSSSVPAPLPVSGSGSGSAAPPSSKACWACGAEGVPLKRCSVCEVARYCTAACQQV